MNIKKVLGTLRITIAKGKDQVGLKQGGNEWKGAEFLREDDAERLKKPRSGCSWRSSSIIYCSTRHSPYINSAKAVDYRFCKCVLSRSFLSLPLSKYVRVYLLMFVIFWRRYIAGSNRAEQECPCYVSGMQQNIYVTNFFLTFLLTVQHAMILGNCPTWRTNSFEYIYLFIVLYMFRACYAHHQEKQSVSIQLLVIVTPCWWHAHLQEY